MLEENERIKAIKILNLDLERSNLELKKKEIEVKLADLNKNQSVHIQASDSFRPSAVKLAGIFVHGDGRQALFEVDGTYVHAGQGEQVKEGVLVKEIKNDKVILEFKDGKQQTFILGS